MIGIYQILNTVNNKRYIGSSKNISNRLKEHKRKLEDNTHHNSYLQKSFNKYGIKNFTFSPIIECSLKDLIFYEDLIMKGYKSNQRQFGYNLKEAWDTRRPVNKPGVNSLLNAQYHRLKLIAPIDPLDEFGKWSVKCECGNTSTVLINDVIRGHTKSCGCLNREEKVARINHWNKSNREVISQRIKTFLVNNPKPWNLTHNAGDKYNRLTLISPGPRKGDKRFWLCRCDCGVEKYIDPGKVKSGHTKSCGCWNKEVVAKRIKRINLEVDCFT